MDVDQPRSTNCQRHVKGHAGLYILVTAADVQAGPTVAKPDQLHLPLLCCLTQALDVCSIKQGCEHKPDVTGLP